MNWPVVALSDFCQTGSGGTPSRRKNGEYYGGGIPWVKSGELRDDVLNFTDEHITDLALQESSAKVVPAGAVLVAMYGATVGRTALLEVDASTNQAVCFIIPESNLAVSRFVWYLLRASYDDLLAKRVGGAQPNISQQIIRRLRVPLPPLSEQRRIVEILDHAEALRKRAREADAKAARILPALFLKMFGDPAANPMDWPVKVFADVFSDTTAGNRKLQTKEFQESGKLAVIDQGQAQIAGYTDEESLAYNGGLPVVVFGDHTRIFKYVDHPFMLGADGVRVLTPKPHFNPLFAYWHCRLLDIPSAGYSRHFKFLKEKSFICPDEPLQNDFAKFAQVFRSQTSTLANARADVERLFATMMTQAFSGQLTAKWHQAHMQELLAEMREQARLLDLPMPDAKEFTK